MITITISGPRACGKSTLAHYIASKLEQDGHNILVSCTVDKFNMSNFEPQGMREILIREDNYSPFAGLI
jgi:predicted AAA+ superfamily ATPase